MISNISSKQRIIGVDVVHDAVPEFDKWRRTNLSTVSHTMFTQIITSRIAVKMRICKRKKRCSRFYTFG